MNRRKMNRSRTKKRAPYPTPGRRRRQRIRRFHLNPAAGPMLEALRGYDPRGVPVVLGYPEMELAGKIFRQRFGAHRSQYIVIFDDAISQEDYEAAMGMPSGGARGIYDQARRWKLRTDRGDIRAIDEEGSLKWYQGPWNYWNIDVVEAPVGTLADWEEPATTREEYHSVILPGEIRVTSGRFVGLQKDGGRNYTDVALLELFEPLPLWQLPAFGIEWDAYKKSYASADAYFIPSWLWEDHQACVKEKLGNAVKVPNSTPPMHALEDPRPYKEVWKALADCYDPRWVPETKVANAMHLYFIVPFHWPPERRNTGLRPMRKEQAEGLELEVFEGAEWLEGLE